MFLFKYERFIHDFVGFDGCLLDSEIKLKGRTKWSFFQDVKHPFALLIGNEKFGSSRTGALLIACCAFVV